MKKETQYHNFHEIFNDNKNIVGGIAILMNLSSYIIIGCLLYIGKNSDFNQKILIVGGIAILMNLSSYLIFGGLLYHGKLSDNQKIFKCWCNRHIDEFIELSYFWRVTLFDY